MVRPENTRQMPKMPLLPIGSRGIPCRDHLLYSGSTPIIFSLIGLMGITGFRRKALCIRVQYAGKTDANKILGPHADVKNLPHVLKGRAF